MPDEIAHLDFDPDTTPEADEQDEELHECQITTCTRVAVWVGRMGCCKYRFRICDTCRKVVVKIGVKCKDDACGKSREPRWITGWTRL